ncbi:hypothetical protein [Mesorhizobium sp. 2RAF21]|jgi:hypothetical protein|uniref:hypothetical protein n=1 Tax=Mesorhizobium sp. 2RAF21 TaxID=3232995 RepID=UPI003F9821E5
MRIRRTCQLSGDSSFSFARGVIHAEDEEAFALVARADLCRREQSSLNVETQSL